MSDPTPVLEPATQEFVRHTANPPYVYDMTLDQLRKAADALQSGPVPRPEATISSLPGGLRLIRPAGATGVLPVVLYLHGGGWVVGGAATHDRLVRELAVRADAAVVFVEYSRSPEVRYPVAVEECHAALTWVAEHGAAYELDPSRIAVAGDSSGGTMAAALAIMAAPLLAGQLLYYPTLDTSFDTASYDQFATGYWMRRDAMRWFWDQYAPSAADRAQVTAAPLRAGIAELTGLPPALLVVGEADVLRDEGEAYARNLRRAGVAVTGVRYQGAIHDFVMLDALRETQAARAAVAQGGSFLREVLH
nr:alpha/beta hydrolase [uncultured Actinoplanes sp.]